VWILTDAEKVRRLAVGCAANKRAYRRSKSGSLATMAATCRVSSRVSKLAAVRRPGSSSKYTVGERLTRCADVEVFAMLIDRPGWQERRGGALKVRNGV
jgi:hypothetical protein